MIKAFSSPAGPHMSIMTYHSDFIEFYAEKLLDTALSERYRVRGLSGLPVVAHQA
jgi:hypothetical protein